MGKSHSKSTFSQWDLDRFSNVTGIPRARVEQLYQEFVASTGKDNQMDKKEFRRLYRELYLSAKTGSDIPAVITEHDLEKLADRVFKAFDSDGTGKLSFEQFVNAYLLLDRRDEPNTAITARDRFSYVLDHHNPTPGFITREHGEQVLDHLNRYYTVDDVSKPVTTTWEQHWSRLDDGSGRVPQEKFVEYVTTSDDYKNNLNRALL
ncbi:unnamed protein product [Adineta steineri]|uniref:EF-hand domain-containing protein n=1 Tax=Adineta steineri TaxID=433720 RepID=A0A815RR87_9BILA|nr:unnamed protein product [Adineta steineri]CAF1481256.1 unnamed protein product [Adineta steineri]